MSEGGCESVPPLSGHVVGVTGDRRVEELTSHLRALGASVLHGPMLHTRPVRDDDSRLRTATATVIARPPDYLLATTGIGIRSWINSAATWGARADLLEALSHTKVLARGPKVVGALYEAGLPIWFVEPTARTSAMAGHLTAAQLSGARVAIQLPGDDMADIVRRLRAAGAEVLPIAVYDWTWPDDLGPARRLLREVVERRVSALTFTSRPAVRNLVALARDDGVLDAVVDALAGPVVPICVGSVTADELRASTGVESCQPASAVLGMLVQAVTDEIMRREHHHVRTSSGRDVIVQRRMVDGNDVAVTMSDREAELLACLIGARRRTVHKDRLLRAVWRGEDVDPSVLDTTMARLRRRLAATGLRVDTISGRGYLLQGDVVPCASTRHRSDSETLPVTVVRP